LHGPGCATCLHGYAALRRDGVSHDVAATAIAVGLGYGR
jgi:hypothetical protein